MPRLKWGEGPPMYDQGVDRGVLYLDEGAAPWNGLVSVDESDTSMLDTETYFDGVRRRVTETTGDFEGRISAYTYPDVFGEYNGYSERNLYQRFGFSYRTEYGGGHLLHILYNVLVRDDQRQWKTQNRAVDPSLFNWDIYAAAEPIPGASPAAHLAMQVPDSSDELFEAIEDILYGTDATEPRLPGPAELIELYESYTQLKITYNGDGTYTASGPDSMVTVLSDGRFVLNSPTVFFVNPNIFRASSY